MSLHVFGQSGRPGIDRCARCGTERELFQTGDLVFWWYRHGRRRAYLLWPQAHSEGRDPGPCVAKEAA